MPLRALCEHLSDLNSCDGYAYIAEQLLEHTVICCRGAHDQQLHHFAIEDIEFYQQNDGGNAGLYDVFGHASEAQIASATWYFHGAGKYKTGFAEGTYKGLDITFGPKTIRGGILLRRIRHLQSNLMTEGPCRIVDAFLKLAGFTKVRPFHDVLVEQGQLSINATKSILHVSGMNVPIDKRERLSRIWAIPRYGLSWKRKTSHYDLHHYYLKAPYRFTQHIPHIGAVHLLCAVFDTLPETLLLEEENEKIIKTVMLTLGLPTTMKQHMVTYQRWLQMYLSGLTLTDKEDSTMNALICREGKPHATKDVANMFGYLRRIKCPEPMRSDIIKRRYKEI